VQANIVKYIKMAASSNFGNVFTVLGSSVFLPFLPMLPLQLLVQNLLYDLSQTTIPFDPVDAEDLAKPRKWEALGIARFMLFLGPISSVFDLATFALLWWIFGAYSPQKQSLFQSGWFVEGLLSQTLIVHMIRTRHVPFFQSWPCTPLVSTTIAIVIIGAILPFTAIGSAIGLVPLPIS
jgi:Mg2+-importing ATPase